MYKQYCLSFCLLQKFKDYGDTSFCCLENKTDCQKNYAIYLAITHERVVRYIRTEYEIDGLFQFDNGKVVCRNDAKILNQRLAFVLSEYQE